MNANGWVKVYRKLPGDSKVRSLSASKRWIVDALAQGRLFDEDS